MNRDDIPLLRKESRSGLPLLFATLCIVDIFGVFPIIALPRAIVQCGWLGIPLVFVVFGFQIYTASLLGKSWNIATAVDPHIFQKNRYPLAAVTELTLGRWPSYCVSVLLDLTIFGGGIPNLLVASQNLQLFGLKVSDQSFNLSFCYWLLLVGILLCPIMWLGSPRDMKWLVTFSAFTVSITALIIWWTIINDNRDISFSSVPTSPSWENFISGGTLFAITAGLAVWRYGGSTTANVLQVMPPSAAIQAAILIAALQLCLSSAIGHSALFQHLEDQLHVQRSFSWKRCAMRSAVVFLGVAVGESVPRFDIVMSLIGGTLIGPLVFVLPPLMYSRARELRLMGLRRASAPELLCSGPERRTIENRELFTDKRVHSKSTHYGFRNGDDDRNDGYSFIYYDYDDDMEMNPYTESREDLLDEQYSQSRNLGETLELSRSGSLPVMVDASRPSIRRPRRNDMHYASVRKPRKFFTVQRMIDLFGYFIVIVGVLITLSSTYINVKNTIRFVKFTPPCIVNATATIPSLL